ncbi:protein nepro like [Crotalus adamanteus]|uniref:Protein nepro like n=1 Tax=Crotalus adamanteus TaxID=8729 RepID=A0AAW1BKF1_CROAD
MAAPGGGEMVWNRWDVPWPACNSAEVVPAEHASVRCLSAVLKRCGSIDSMLKCKVLVAEQRLLHSIIYNYHYQMIHQKTYGSLKQVEQCLKRLNLMNLEKSIQKIAQMDLIKQRSENSAESLVPSQPVIEVVLVKILGSCKLILRLLECFCTTFSLIVKHLCLEEYVLFNTLILGLLSRLWILYRAILKKLIRKKKKNISDIGEPVLINRPNQDLAEKLEFDLKTLCKYPNPVSQENSKFSNMLPESKKIASISSKVLRSRHLHSFVSKFKEVQNEAFKKQEAAACGSPRLQIAAEA